MVGMDAHVKAKGGQSSVITTLYLSVLAIPYGRPDKKDRTLEYFSKRTDLGNYNKAVFHNHEPERLYGCVVDTHRLPSGVYALCSVTLFPEDKWLLEEIRDDRVYASSGTGGLGYKVDDQGHIYQWSFVELSLVTPYTNEKGKSSLPANWLARAHVATTWKNQSISQF